MAQSPGFEFLPSSRAPLTPRDPGTGNLTPPSPPPDFLGCLETPLGTPGQVPKLPGSGLLPLIQETLPLKKSQDLDPQITSLSSGSAPLPGPSRQPGNLQVRPSGRESPSGPFLTGHPPPLMLAILILPLGSSHGLGPTPHSPPLAGPTWKLLSRCLQYPITPSPQVSQALIRSFSSTARNRLENRVAEKQKLFQVSGAGAGRGEDLGP